MMMQEIAASPLAHWDNFYVIVGSSAGALTGLQFVVIALIAEAQTAASKLEIRAFGSPTVVHFCAALLVSGILCAPWESLANAAITLELCGAAGLIYAMTVVRHARTQTGYQADAEDWTWYVILPLAAYGTLLVAATELKRHTATSLFVIAGTTLTLLFVGIHNAWDTVTYIALRNARKPNESQSE